MLYRVGRKALVMVLAFSMLALPLLAGCTKHPSPEELSQLDEARMAAEGAEKKLEEKKAEKAQLEAELAQKKAELEALKEKGETVKSKVE